MPQDSGMDTKISPAKANRKIAKPIMEKKRRARINASLNELKSLLVEVLQKEGCRHSSKMEKADILEMAVRHLKNLQKQQASAVSTNQTVREAYQQIPLLPEKYPSQMSMECQPNQIGQFLRCSSSIDCRSQHSSPEPARELSPSTVKTNLNKNPQSNPKPLYTSVTTQSGAFTFPPIITQNSEIALVFPPHVLKHSNTPGFIVPVYTTATALPSNINKQEQPVMISINMPVNGPSSSSAFTKINTSRAPVSPVWRPW